VLTEDCSHVISPQVVKDSYHMDKLVYGTEKGQIVLRMLPSMLRFRRLQVSTEHPVLTVIVSPDRRFLHVGCGDGGLIVITERGSSGSSSSSHGSSSQHSTNSGTRNHQQSTQNQLTTQSSAQSQAPSYGSIAATTSQGSISKTSSNPAQQ